MEIIEYKGLVSKLVNEFNMSLTNKDEQLEQKMSQKFEEYLYMLIDKWGNPAHKFLAKSREKIELDLKQITKRFSGYNFEEKERMLIEDENFKKIASFSNEVYNIAVSTLRNKGNQLSDVKVLEDRFAEIIELENDVKNYNKDAAKKLISETILDIEFIKNPKRELYSLRLAEVKRMIDEFEKKNSNVLDEEER